MRPHHRTEGNPESGYHPRDLTNDHPLASFQRGISTENSSLIGITAIPSLVNTFLLTDLVLGVVVLLVLVGVAWLVLGAMVGSPLSAIFYN